MGSGYSLQRPLPGPLREGRVNGTRRIDAVPWEDAFFKALSRLGEVGRLSPSIAAHRAGVSKGLVYRRRKESSEFRKRWDEIVILCHENQRQKLLRRESNRPLPDDIQ